MESITLFSFVSSEKEKAICAELKPNFKLHTKIDQNTSALLFLFDNPALHSDSTRQQVLQLLHKYQHCLHFCLTTDDVDPTQLNNLANPFLSLFNDLLFWPCQSCEIATRISRFRTKNMAPPALTKKLLLEFVPLNLIGESTTFTQVLSLIKKVSQFNAPVVIAGETGTGKENAARAVHYLSNRADHSFVPINCGALPDELLESELFGHCQGAFTDAKSNQPGLVKIADGGTLFLDEVDSLSPKAQATLLRFLQTGEYRPLGGKVTLTADVRIIVASNADIDNLVKKGSFREDLMYRLNVLSIRIPPLRERKQDIDILAKHFIDQFVEHHGSDSKELTNASLQWLRLQTWPGNVRELENTLLRHFLLSEGKYIHIGSDSNDTEQSNSHTSSCGSFQAEKAAAIRRFEKNYLTNILQQTEGNVSEAARLSGKERRALGKLMQKYELQKEFFTTCTGNA